MFLLNFLRLYIMVVTFFALRPMFAATDRLAVDKSAFLAGLSVSYFSRKSKATRHASFYNSFGITTTLINLDALEKFALTHSFMLMAAFFGGHLTTLSFAKSAYSFSSLFFYPAGLLSVSLRLALLPLLKILGLTFLNSKSRVWLL